MNNPWSADGVWLKGALHTHTANSDGAFPPAQVVDLYRRCGYDFVVFTDHGRVTDPGSADAGDIIVIGGAEIGVGTADGYTTYHLVAVGLEPQAVQGLETSSAQEVVDALVEAGALVYVAHPYWSGLRDEHLLALAGVDGVEVFNAGCEYETRHGEAGQHWDWALARGRRWRAIAVDDAHNYQWDACRGWTWVRASQRSPEAILQALRDGNFYASAGPTIDTVAIAEGTVAVICRDAAAVHLIMPQAGRGWSSGRLCKRPPCRPTATEVEIPAPPAGELFRIEVVDGGGNKAWTNPMRVG